MPLGTLTTINKLLFYEREIFMWDRKELKRIGKDKYRDNRLMCIIAAMLLSIAGGGGIGLSIPSSTSAPSQPTVTENTPVVTPEGTLPPGAATAIIAIIILVIAISMLITALLLNPLLVGARRFFLDNATAPASLGGDNLGIGFRNWRFVVGSIFSTQMLVFLWSLLLVVPGIIKAYEWRMVSYIVAENPEISGREARELSSIMMNGSKWDAFVLDLSFMGWILLGGFTFGILNIVFVNPYKAATDTELYYALSEQTTEVVSAS